MRCLFFSMMLLLNAQIHANQSESIQALNEAIAIFEQGDESKAKVLFSRLEDNAVALTYMARIVSEDDLDEAEALIEKAYSIAPTNAMTAYHRGMIMGKQASDAIFSALSYAKKSRISFEQAVALEPDNIVYRRGLMMFHLSAPSIAGGDIQIASEQLDAIKSMSAYFGMHAQLEFYRQQDDDQQYLKTANQAVQQFADLPDFYTLHGLALQENEQYEQAVALFITASQKQANFDESEKYRFMAVYQIGRTAVLSKNWFEQGHDALVNYLAYAPEQRGLPDKEWATYRLAQILYFQQKHNDAKVLLNTLIKSNDGDLQKRAKKLLKRSS